MYYSNGITKKNKFLQLFCKHKNIRSFTQQSQFQNLSGERVYHICEDCGKLKDEQFLQYEEMGYK